MFLHQHEIAQSRDYTLNNLLGISAACLEAGQRLSELFSSHGRDALHASSQQISQFSHGQLDQLTRFPATLWLEHSSRTSKLLSATYEIVGETHRMLFHSAEAQVRVADEITYASIDRLTRTSQMPAAEQTRHSVSSTSHIEPADGQQIDCAIDEQTGQKPKAPARSRTRAN